MSKNTFVMRPKLGESRSDAIERGKKRHPGKRVIFIEDKEGQMADDLQKAGRVRGGDDLMLTLSKLQSRKSGLPSTEACAQMVSESRRYTLAYQQAQENKARCAEVDFDLDLGATPKYSTQLHGVINCVDSIFGDAQMAHIRGWPKFDGTARYRTTSNLDLSLIQNSTTIATAWNVNFDFSSKGVKTKCILDANNVFGTTQLFTPDAVNAAMSERPQEETLAKAFGWDKSVLRRQTNVSIGSLHDVLVRARAGYNNYTRLVKGMLYYLMSCASKEVKVSSNKFGLCSILDYDPSTVSSQGNIVGASYAWAGVPEVGVYVDFLLLLQQKFPTCDNTDLGAFDGLEIPADGAMSVVITESYNVRSVASIKLTPTHIAGMLVRYASSTRTLHLLEQAFMHASALMSRDINEIHLPKVQSTAELARGAISNEYELKGHLVGWSLDYAAKIAMLSAAQKSVIIKDLRSTEMSLMSGSQYAPLLGLLKSSRSKRDSVYSWYAFNVFPIGSSLLHLCDPLVGMTDKMLRCEDRRHLLYSYWVCQVERIRKNSVFKTLLHGMNATNPPTEGDRLSALGVATRGQLGIDNNPVILAEEYRQGGAGPNRGLADDLCFGYVSTEFQGWAEQDVQPWSEVDDSNWEEETLPTEMPIERSAIMNPLPMDAPEPYEFIPTYVAEKFEQAPLEKSEPPVQPMSKWRVTDDKEVQEAIAALTDQVKHAKKWSDHWSKRKEDLLQMNLEVAGKEEKVSALLDAIYSEHTKIGRSMGAEHAKRMEEEVRVFEAMKAIQDAEIAKQRRDAEVAAAQRAAVLEAEVTSVSLQPTISPPRVALPKFGPGPKLEVKIPGTREIAASREAPHTIAQASPVKIKPAHLSARIETDRSRKLVPLGKMKDTVTPKRVAPPSPAWEKVEKGPFPEPPKMEQKVTTVQDIPGAKLKHTLGAAVAKINFGDMKWDSGRAGDSRLHVVRQACEKIGGDVDKADAHLEEHVPRPIDWPIDVTPIMGARFDRLQMERAYGVSRTAHGERMWLARSLVKPGFYGGVNGLWALGVMMDNLHVMPDSHMGVIKKVGLSNFGELVARYRAWPMLLDLSCGRAPAVGRSKAAIGIVSRSLRDSGYKYFEIKQWGGSSEALDSLAEACRSKLKWEPISWDEKK